MNNLLQSDVRKDIKSIIYQEPYFTIELFDTPYFWIKKIRKKAWLAFKRYQILGIELPKDQKWIQEEIKRLKKDYTGWNNIFFQLWISNIITQFSSPLLKNEEFSKQVRFKRELVQSQLKNQYQLIPSFRENMSLATVIIDTNKSDEELLKYMNSWAQRHVRKALRSDIEFAIADKDEYDIFYEERHKISSLKNFNIIDKQTFLRLMDYLISNQCGDIFIARKGDIILWWSIAIFHDDTITYLYWFSNRDPRFHNIGVHHFIKYKMFSRSREHNYQYLDLFGGAPSWYPDHPLRWVSSFKESLWGDKLEYYGNFDIVLNPLLYKAMKRIYKKRK